MGAVCGCNRGTAISSEHNSAPQVSRRMTVTNESAPTVGCEVPAVAHEQMPPLEVVEASSWYNNKRVQEARRARVEWLESLRRNCATEEEFQTARTQPIWTQVGSSLCSSSCTPQDPSPADLQRIHEENRLHFQHLMNYGKHNKSYPWYEGILTLGGIVSNQDGESCKFYVDFGDTLSAGQKIGGGGQADIHEAIYNGKAHERFVLKVFRGECLLRDLERTWAKDIGHSFRQVRRTLKWVGGLEKYCGIHHGTLLQDGQFAFVLERCWGDLRKYIDLQIVKDKTHCSPPFPHSRTLEIMEDIASGMLFLHERGIIHKDLKAANCLLERGYSSTDPRPKCMVADFDSSVGVVGTGFWRAPEVLLALRDKQRGVNSVQEVWTEEADVYSYAMTCYEVLTGCIPFEGRAANDYDGVIGGERPLLPDYLDLELEKLVRRCWHPNPCRRPSFYMIVNDIQHIRYVYNHF